MTVFSKLQHALGVVIILPALDAGDKKDTAARARDIIKLDNSLKQFKNWCSLNT